MTFLITIQDEDYSSRRIEHLSIEKYLDPLSSTNESSETKVLLFRCQYKKCLNCEREKRMLNQEMFIMLLPQEGFSCWGCHFELQVIQNGRLHFQDLQ